MQVLASDSKELANDARKEMNSILKKLNGRVPKAERFQLRSELATLRKEVRQREARAVEEVMSHASVVLATNAGAADRHMRNAGDFDVVVIDEAAQALEVSCWIPILRAKKAVLAGDHCQLPPTVTSAAAAKGGLATTLFDRMRRRHPQCVHMLDVQYRMHAAIAQWSSVALYEGRLASAPEVAAHRLCHLSQVEEGEETQSAMMVIDTAGCEMGEQKDEAGSTFNEGEAMVVQAHVERLLAAGLPQAAVAVITPYNAQVAVLRNKLKPLYPAVEIGSVDGFQGREKEAVVLSLVRSNASREVGFLAEDRRLNVAITRARRHVALVCDADTIRRHTFLAAMLDYVEAEGLEWRSALEYLPDGLVGYAPGAAMGAAAAASSSSKAKPKAKPKRAPKPKGPRKGGPGPSTEETPEQQEERKVLETRVAAFAADDAVSELQFGAGLLNPLSPQRPQPQTSPTFALTFANPNGKNVRVVNFRWRWLLPVLG